MVCVERKMCGVAARPGKGSLIVACVGGRTGEEAYRLGTGSLMAVCVEGKPGGKAARPGTGSLMGVCVQGKTYEAGPGSLPAACQAAKGRPDGAR